MWLEELRTEKKLTQLELAEMAGVDRATISKLENEKYSPSVGLAKKLGILLGFEWTKFYESQEKEG